MSHTETETKDRDFWEDMRDTVRAGLSEIRSRGDELARQGRLRMDVYQTERRLKSAYELLGDAAYAELSRNRAVSTEEAKIKHLTDRVRYYQDELSRLQSELSHHSDSRQGT